MMKRRDALKTIGGLAGAAGMARFLPGCGGGDDGPVGITTYVYLMLENRTLRSRVRRRASSRASAATACVAGMSNPDMNGNPVALFDARRARQMCVDRSAARLGRRRTRSGTTAR